MIRCCAVIWRAKGQLNILLQAGLEPDPRIKDVPQALQAARSPEERQALELFFARVAMGRPFVLPPGVPADRVTALRTAFQVMLKDPAFLADAEKLRLRVVATTGERMTALLADAYKTPPAIVQRADQGAGARRVVPIAAEVIEQSSNRQNKLRSISFLTPSALPSAE